VGPVEGLIRTGDGDRLVMAYLWMTLSGEELGRYEGYYMVFRDYGADEGMRHYKSFLIMQRFIAEAWRELSERFLEVFRYPVERVLNITPTPSRSSGCAERVGWHAEEMDDILHRDAEVAYT
jgi:hypothetical protein